MIKRFKDKIKNKVISPDYVVVGLITGCIVFLLCGILILLIALFYDKVELWADILMFIIAGFCFVAFLLYAIFVPILLLQYPKHKKLLHVLLKKSVFCLMIRLNDFEAPVLQLNTKRKSRPL